MPYRALRAFVLASLATSLLPSPLLAQEAESTLRRTERLFPQTEHWFDLVETTQFQHLGGARLRPDLSTLSHPRVRDADGAGHAIVPTFPTRYTGPVRIASRDLPSVWIEVTPVDAHDAPAVVEDGVVTYAGAYDDTDVLTKSTPTHVDEYLVLSSREAPSRWTFRVRRGPGIARLRQAGRGVEAVDGNGVAWLRATPPYAIDRDGTRVDGELRVEGELLVASLDLAGLEPPILVDPDWRSTGDMAYGRFYHGSNVLPDGRVLATGGCTASVCSGDLTLPACRAVVTAAEALSLETRTWTRAGDAATPRFFHVSQSLPDGSVLLAGGCTDPACHFATETTEVYDVGSGAFVSGPTLPEPLAGITSTILSDGSIFMAGGCTDAACTARAWIFEPATRTLRDLAPMRGVRGRAIAEPLPGGRVLVAGGCTTILCADVLATAEIYDVAAGTWRDAGSLSVPRGGHYAAALLDGRVLVGGGCPDQGCLTVHTSAELFDPTSATFSPVGEMARPRYGAVATALVDGTVMVSQGCAGATDCDLTNELFDPAAGGFSSIENAVTTRAFHTLVLHPGRVVIAIGGCQPRTCSWWNETYDVSSLRAPDAAMPDAGPSPDAWTDLDSGTDAGHDAGWDAGMDAGSDAGDGDFAGGACGCRAARARAAPAWAACGGLLALALARRRRARGAPAGGPSDAGAPS